MAVAKPLLLDEILSLQNSLGEFLGQGALASQASQTVQMGWEDLEDTFGDRLVMLYHEETEYALCAI